MATHQAIRIAGVFVVQGIRFDHDYRGIRGTAYAKQKMLMEADRLRLKCLNPNLPHMAPFVFPSLANASYMLCRMSPRPEWEYLIARIFGIPSLCCQEGKLVSSSANVKCNGSEMHAVESSSISLAKQ